MGRKAHRSASEMGGGSGGEGISSDDHARDNVTEAELALDQNGNFLAMRVSTEANLGAYVRSWVWAPLLAMLADWRVSIRRQVCSWRSSAASAISIQSHHTEAPGDEASYVMERMIHLAAREPEIDPIELRRRNMISPTQMPYKTPLTFTYDCGEFKEP